MMPTLQQWLFGPFRLDTATSGLWCDETPVALTPKAFDGLHYLVTHPDRLVTKEELLMDAADREIVMIPGHYRPTRANALGKSFVCL